MTAGVQGDARLVGNVPKRPIALIMEQVPTPSAGVALVGVGLAGVIFWELAGAPNGAFRYVPQESGYSRDADKIEATMATWRDVDSSQSHESARTLTPAR